MDGAHRGGGRSVLLQPRLRVYFPVRSRGSVSVCVCVCVCAGREPSDRESRRKEGRCQLRREGGGGRTEEGAQTQERARNERCVFVRVRAYVCVLPQKKYGKQPPFLPRRVNKYSNVNKQAQTRNKVTQLRSSPFIKLRNWELNDFPAPASP